MKHGKARFENDFAKLRALTILQRKIQLGCNNSVLAKEFHCHESTIKRNLNMAIQTGIFEKLEKDLFDRLAPKAIDALDAALVSKNRDSAAIALEVLKGIGLFHKPVDRRILQLRGKSP